MAVRKIGPSWWIDFRYERTRYRKRSPVNTRAGAQEYEAMLRQRLVRGNSSVAITAPALFESAADKWFKTYVKTNVKYSTEKLYGYVLKKHLLPAFGGRRLASITSFDIEAFKADKRSAGLKPGTINSFLIVLGCLLHRAHEWGWLRHVPEIKNLKAPPQRFDFLSDAEIKRLLSACRSRPMRTMILAGLRTGMRRCELMGLRWEDVDLRRRLITVQRAMVLGRESSPKNNRTRQIPIALDLGEALERADRNGPLVFPRENRKPRTVAAVDWAIRSACERAGLRSIGWHVLRHTFASQLAARGAPLPAIQALLGHASIQMTMRYSHMAPATLRDAVGLLTPAEEQRAPRSGQRAVNMAPVAAPQARPRR